MQIIQTENLIDIIDVAALSARTDSFDVSFGELASMYPEELEINPEFQRYFRWSETQQSQFIESLILGLPIPPIFVVETANKKYELIDGLQRISSFLHFMGLLKIRSRYPDGDKLKLINCDIVPELNGLTSDNLTAGLRIQVKRSYVRMHVIKQGSSPRLKYDMFKRLNTGGSLLSEQEVRNSTIRLLDEKFIGFIKTMQDDDDFKNCLHYVTENSIENQFDSELVLRFFTLKNAKLVGNNSYVGTLADYMTTYAERVALNDSGLQTALNLAFDYETERSIFIKTFKILNKTLGKNIFSGKSGNSYQNQFLAFHYEAFSIGVASFYKKLDSNNETQMENLKNCLENLKTNSEFINATMNDKERRTSGSQYVKWFNIRVKLVKDAISSHVLIS
ncbi:MAG: hypothetical protein RLZZ292_1829 [Bacteroidota bacterium]|jgi:hypothetical protein